MNALEISRTGLDVEWRRLEVIAQNLANVGSTVDPAGQPVRALRLISGPAQSFSDVMANRSAVPSLAGAAVYSIEPQNIPPRRVYEPAHPQADSDGYVTYPGFDHAGEMALMVKTSRAYEANIVAFNTARQMYGKALEIGKRS